MLKKFFETKVCRLACAALLALLCGVHGVEAADTPMYDLFWRRAWAAMDKAYASKRDASPREHALMANALRLRGKWTEAVAVLEAHSASFPQSVRPYADMTLLLGYERTGRTEEALALSERLWRSAPKDLKYYIASAQYRLRKDGEPRAVQVALERMLQAADTKERRIYVLSRLVRLPGDRTAQALSLLKLQAGNKAAAEVLSLHKKPWPQSVRVALGVYAHLKKDDKTAVERLASVPIASAEGRRAAYYRAWSLYRLKRRAEALALWGSLAEAGNAYAESSVRRIGILARDDKKDAVPVLERIVKARKGKPQARALLVLSGLVDEDQKGKLEDRLLRGYPDTAYAFEVLWRRGWASLNAKNPSEAVRLWRQAYAPGSDASRKARILYWIAHAERAAGKAAEAEKTLDALARNHPLSIYTFMGRPGTIKILDGENPALASKPRDLELWGFVLYARLRLQAPGTSARDLYRSLKLARWLGLEEAYEQARRMTGLMTSGTTLYRSDLEALYPRPFRTQVEKACGTYGVENHFVWAVMRQESAFKPRATSWAGASGLMQLMPGTAKGEAKRMGLKQYNIYDIADNIAMGTSHLAWLSKSFARKDWVMAAYNAGSGNARKWLKDGRDKMSPDRWIEEVRFNETCDYVQKVSGNLAVYRMLYGTEELASGDIAVPAAEDAPEAAPLEDETETVD